MKDKDPMIISPEAEKAFDKIQCPFVMSKNSHNKVGIEGMYLNIIQAVYMTIPQQTSSSTVES